MRGGRGRGTRGRRRALGTQGRPNVTASSITISDGSGSESEGKQGNLPESDPESVHFEHSGESDASDGPQNLSAPSSAAAAPSRSTKHVSVLPASRPRGSMPREHAVNEKTSMWDLSTVWAANIAVVRRTDTPASGLTCEHVFFGGWVGSRLDNAVLSFLNCLDTVYQYPSQHHFLFNTLFFVMLCWYIPVAVAVVSLVVM